MFSANFLPNNLAIDHHSAEPESHKLVFNGTAPNVLHDCQRLRALYNAIYPLVEAGRMPKGLVDRLYADFTPIAKCATANSSQSPLFPDVLESTVAHIPLATRAGVKIDGLGEERDTSVDLGERRAALERLLNVGDRMSGDEYQDAVDRFLTLHIPSDGEADMPSPLTHRHRLLGLYHAIRPLVVADRVSPSFVRDLYWHFAKFDLTGREDWESLDMVLRGGDDIFLQSSSSRRYQAPHYDEPKKYGAPACPHTESCEHSPFPIPSFLTNTASISDYDLPSELHMREHEIQNILFPIGEDSEEDRRRKIDDFLRRHLYDHHDDLAEWRETLREKVLQEREERQLTRKRKAAPERSRGEVPRLWKVPRTSWGAERVFDRWED